MKIEFMAIGDELLNGTTREINATWLGQFLTDQALQLTRVTILKDDRWELQSALTHGLENSQIIILSGGLGPTRDDLTKQSLANFFNLPLVDDAGARAISKKNYARIGKTWHPQLNSYHIIPEFFTALDNPTGLAPGLRYKIPQSDQVLLVAPGVPSEFSSMVQEVFFPYLRDHHLIVRKKIHRATIRTRGIYEEKIFTELCPTLWDDLAKYGKVSSLPQTLGVDIIVQFSADSDRHKLLRQKIFSLVADGPLKEYVWQYGNLSLPALIIQQAKKKKLKIALAESCTGGLAASLLTDIPGSSEVFTGALVTYSNRAKQDLLQVKAATLEKYGAISTQTAREMAKGAQAKLKADIVVAFTGLAGPPEKNPTEQLPVGTVAIATTSVHHSTCQVMNFHGERKKLKLRFATMGLFILLQHIEKYPQS